MATTDDDDGGVGRDTAETTEKEESAEEKSESGTLTCATDGSSVTVVDETAAVQTDNELADKESEGNPKAAPLHVSLSDDEDEQECGVGVARAASPYRLYVQHVRPGDADDDVGLDAMSTCLLESLSLPGTPAVNTDDSGDSCSSTRSNQQLLFRQHAATVPHVGGGGDDDDDVTLA